MDDRSEEADELNASGVRIVTDGIHLASADLAALHNFAAAIGLPRRWFHPHRRHPHYDLLTVDARRRALEAGAVVVRSRDIVALLKANFEGDAGRRWLQAARRLVVIDKPELTMISYAVTVSIDADIAEEWIQWMRSVHIPDVLATGLFRGARMMRVTEPPAAARPTFRFEYTLADRDAFDVYQREHAPRLQADHTERYAGRFEASRSVAELHDEWKV